MKKAEIPEKPEVEAIVQYGEGAIRIEREFCEELDRDVEYVNIRGVRVRRRDENDKYQGDEKAPVFAESPEQFKDLTFGEPEIEFLRAAMMRYVVGQHSLFLGPPGFGKSRMMKFMAYLLNIPFFRVSCEKGMDVQQQFLWTFVRDNGSLKGRLGPLPQSMLAGGLLLVDELPNLEPAERQVILEPTERPHNPRVFNEAPTLHMHDFPGLEMTVQARPGWFMAASGNYREGQGFGEIYGLSEREERRVRPHMLGVLPAGTHAKRMAGRFRAVSTAVESTAEQNVYSPEPYRRGMADLPDSVIDMTTELFEAVEAVLKKEVLANLRQDPKVFLNETAHRAFEHFMMFQLESARETRNAKMESIMGSALQALEFYFINAFREETLMKVPQLPGLDAQSVFGALLDSNGRVPVRAYVKWRLKNMMEQKLWETPEKIRQSYRERLEEVYFPEKKLEEKIDGEMEEILGALEAEPAPMGEKPGAPASGAEPAKPAEPPAPAAGPASEPAEFTPEQREKLMINLEKSYDEMKDTLDNYGWTDKIPDKKTVMAAIAKLKPDVLKNIGKFGKPTLLMTPAGDLAYKKAKIDGKKKYSNAQGQQSDTYFDPLPADALWGPPPAKFKVTIVDGAAEMPQLPDDIVQTDWEHRHRWLTEEYKKKGMKMITGHEYAMLAQKSLHSYELAKTVPGKNPEDEIIDKNTVTTFNGEHLTDLQKVPYGYWLSVFREFHFDWFNPGTTYGYLRSRPSVQVLET